MSWFSIPKSFTAGAKAKAAEVNENFAAIAAALNGQFAGGRVSAGEKLNLTGSFQDVPGASLAISPDIPSLLYVQAVFELVLIKSAALFEGALAVDGVNQAALARTVYGESSTGYVDQATQIWCVSLSKAAHTVKLRGRNELVSIGEVTPANTGFTYLLIPDPEP